MIRLATLDDAALLPDVERSAGALFRTLPELAWIAGDEVMSVEAHERIIAARLCWVAEGPDESLIAFISNERFDQDLHIWEISVHTSAQGQGIGRHLIEASIAHSRQGGLESVTLTTFRHVGWNAPYYARLGFDTLTTEALTPRLREVLALEIAHGLPGELRCAMRLALK